MARRSSGGRYAPRPAARPQRSNVPQRVIQAPPPATAQGPARGGLGAAIVDGIGWGTGTAIARRAVDAIMGPPVIQHETVASSPAAAAVPTSNAIEGSNACSGQSKAFQECINHYGSNISQCQFYMDMLSECRRSSSSVVSA